MSLMMKLAAWKKAIASCWSARKDFSIVEMQVTCTVKMRTARSRTTTCAVRRKADAVRTNAHQATCTAELLQKLIASVSRALMLTGIRVATQLRAAILSPQLLRDMFSRRLQHTLHAKTSHAQWKTSITASM
jgi:hypothetical protein